MEIFHSLGCVARVKICVAEILIGCCCQVVFFAENSEAYVECPLKIVESLAELAEVVVYNAKIVHHFRCLFAPRAMLCLGARQCLVEIS